MLNDNNQAILEALVDLVETQEEKERIRTLYKSAPPFAVRLTYAMRLRDMKPTDLARALGNTPSQQAIDAASKRGAGSRHAAAFARVLRVNPVWLSTGQGAVEGGVGDSVTLPITREEEPLVLLYRQLDAHDRPIAEALIRALVTARRKQDHAE